MDDKSQFDSELTATAPTHTASAANIGRSWAFSYQDRHKYGSAFYSLCEGLAVNRRFPILSIVLLLPVLGWISLVPLLLLFPIYVDELQWKLINSRLLLDSGKLLYLFPACSKSVSLDPPISWYPLQLIDALIYSDMTNPQILRYWGIAIFAAIALYCTWFVQLRMRLSIGYPAIAGAVLAPLSLGVLPFLLVINRPEQGLILVVVLGCTIPSILSARKLTPLQSWALASLFALLSWILVGTHVKGVFILPALVLAAVLSIRQWAPILTVVAAAGFGALETIRLWSIRTDCPESPFLMRVFHGQSMSPDDLNAGLTPFLTKIWQNIWGLKTYWQSAGFQQEYQSQWLPPADAPQTFIETILNAAIPTSVAIGVLIIVAAFASALVGAIRNRRVSDSGAFVAMSLLACLICVAGLQTGKNFYESSLTLPLLGIAVMLALTSTTLPSLALRGGRQLMIVLALLAFANQLTIAFRFYPQFSAWQRAIQTRRQEQTTVINLIARCGIEPDAKTRHLLVDDLTYTVLWRTQEPYFLALVDGWWATGVDEADVVRDRNVTGVVGSCSLVSKKIWSSIVSEGGYCCAKRS